MSNKQQSEALEYFNRVAHEWNKNASNVVDIIKQRNDYVLRVINERIDTRVFLDVGCGPGNLVHDVAQKQIRAVGIDVASEMVDIAQKKTSDELLKNTTFECSSIFDYPLEPDMYDVIAANGFIEYISYQELSDFLKLSFSAMASGGDLVMGSRNRLFNIFSLNQFTVDEIKDDTINQLIYEAIKISESNDIKELVGVETVPLQPVSTEHHKTGIDVTTRYQYTPIQLINILTNHGFEVVGISPIHVHGVLPAFKSNHIAVHINISNLLQNYADDISLIPQSSSFMIHAKKGE